MYELAVEAAEENDSLEELPRNGTVAFGYSYKARVLL